MGAGPRQDFPFDPDLLRHVSPIETSSRSFTSPQRPFPGFSATGDARPVNRHGRGVPPTPHGQAPSPAPPRAAGWNHRAGAKTAAAQAPTPWLHRWSYLLTALLHGVGERLREAGDDADGLDALTCTMRRITRQLGESHRRRRRGSTACGHASVRAVRRRPRSRRRSATRASSGGRANSARRRGALTRR